MREVLDGMSVAPSIVIRAALTEDEWKQIQKLAIDRSQRPSELIAEAIRSCLLTSNGPGARPPQADARAATTKESTP